jgi:outer membrane lipoprotein SlyB
MKKILISTAAGAAMLFAASGVALADDYYDGPGYGPGYYDDYDGYDGDYAGPPPGYYDRRHRYRRDRCSGDRAAGTIVGGVAGGVIGNNVGRGRGRGPATVFGAIIGGIIGHEIADDACDSRRRYRHRRYDRYDD